MFTIDSTNKSLGRVASEAAVYLQGKNRPDFDPTKIQTDGVSIKNAARIRITGKKMTQKIYYLYSGYPGGLKQTFLKGLWKKNPARVVRLAIKGMLPKNKTRDFLMKKVAIEL